MSDKPSIDYVATLEMKYKEIAWLKECVTVSNNDTLYYRGRWEEAEKEIESLHDHLVAVEAPLQARIAQLEEAVKHANKQSYPFGHLEMFEKALTELPSTWLSEHDKEVEAKERERCAIVCESSDRYRGEFFAEKIRS